MNPGTALENISDIATAAATKSQKQLCHHYLKWLNSITREKACISDNLFVFIPFKWKRKQKDYSPQHYLKKIYNDLEQRLEEKLNDENSFNNHANNLKELITYFKHKNNKSKKKYDKCETLTTILKSLYTLVIIATTSTSNTLSLTGIALIAIPISVATA